jgi:Ca-activated chloride channel family protein
MMRLHTRRATARCSGWICALVGIGALTVGCTSDRRSPAGESRASSTLTTSDKPSDGMPGQGSAAATATAAASAMSPQQQRQAALKEAQEFGMIGNLSAGSDPNAPAAPWGREVGGAGGADERARGAMAAPVPRLDPNARYATTYRPGGAALSALDSAVARGEIPANYKDLVADFGGRYAPAIAAPAEGAALAFQVDTNRAALAPAGGLVNLRIAIRSSDKMPVRAPLSVHLVLDVSGSMQGAAIDNARKAAETLVQKLEPTDDFSMVTFSSDAKVLVTDGAIGPRRAQVISKIREVRADGGTNISAGLDLGYHEAHTAQINPDAVKIVMLLSDGHANAGESNTERLAARSTVAFQDGIQTSSFGLGADFDASLMSSIADRGAGGYYYLADSTQIATALTKELDARLVPVAQAVEVRVRLRPDVTPTKVYGSHVLDGAEAARVRAQEVAVDNQVKKKDSIAKDRQDDTEGGMRFFMPAFARDDRHAMLLDIQVPAGVGDRSIASVEIKYKDRLRKKNVTEEIAVKTRFAESDAESAKTTNASVVCTTQAFAAGEAILAAAHFVDVGDRSNAKRVLDERAALLKRASETLHEARLGEDALRLARLSGAIEGTGQVKEALPLAVLLRGSGYGYLK